MLHFVLLYWSVTNITRKHNGQNLSVQLLQVNKIFVVYKLAYTALLKRLTLVAASTIVSSVSELLHVTSKSSDEGEEKCLALVKCPSRDLPLSQTSQTNVRLV